MRRPAKKREAPPPAKFIRSVGGTAARVIKTRQTDRRGLWFYRLRYDWRLVGSKLWTLDELLALDARWLKNKPRDLKLVEPR